MRGSSFCIIATLLSVAAPVAASSFTLVKSPADDSTYASGISGNGDVVVGSYGKANGATEAYSFSLGGGFVALGDFPGSLDFSSASAANVDGTVIVGIGYRSDPAIPGDIQVAFRWTAQTGLKDLGDLPGGGFTSFASKVTANGSLVVGASYPASDDFVACKWDEGTITSLGTFNVPMNPRSAATGVSADGAVIVGSSTGPVGSGQNTRAFRWTKGTGLVDIGDLLGGTSYASAAAVSGDGRVTVGASSSAMSGVNGLEAFRHVVNGGMIGLGDLPGGPFTSEALATNVDGSVVVGRSVVDESESEEAFYWTEDAGMQRLSDVAKAAGVDPAPAILRQATGVSDDGRVIVGMAETSKGVRAFRLDLGPAKGMGGAGGGGSSGGAGGEMDGQGGAMQDGGVAGGGGEMQDGGMAGGGGEANEGGSGGNGGAAGSESPGESSGCACRSAPRAGEETMLVVTCVGLGLVAMRRRNARRSDSRAV